MSVVWRLNHGAAVLRDQIRGAHPGAVIGTIGDARHASENPSSDHNPKKLNGANVVNALDPMVTKALTVADIDAIVNALVASRDPRIKYIIWQRRIISGNGGVQPWVWRPYHGTPDPHTGHTHISIKDAADKDTRAWAINKTTTKTTTKTATATKPAPTKPAPKPVAVATLKKGSKGAVVGKLQAALNRHGAKLKVDNDYGNATQAAVRAYQKKVGGLSVDGVAGPRTRAKLGV